MISRAKQTLKRNSRITVNQDARSCEIVIGQKRVEESVKRDLWEKTTWTKKKTTKLNIERKIEFIT